MDRAALAERIDHTVLGPATTPADVHRVCEEARNHGMNVCVPPCYVGETRSDDSALRLATVVGFPHGQHAPATKREEAVRAWDEGADMLDVVLNVGRLKAGTPSAVEAELAEVVAAVPVPVRVIVEAPLLSDEELRTAAKAAVAADADGLKTATGFADGGATPEAVATLSEYLPTKAAGGIANWSTARTMLEAGAEWIGSSHGIKILDGAPDDWSPEGEWG